MNNDNNKKDVVYDIHKEVCDLANEFKKIVEGYFEKETTLISHNEKFLVVNRAISITTKTWFDHFVRSMNPEEINKGQK